MFEDTVSNAIKEEYSVEIFRDPATRKIVGKQYFDANGLLSRPDGPAQQAWDLETGVSIIERYLHAGQRHRSIKEGPAIIQRNPATGKIFYSEYVVYGDIVSAPFSLKQPKSAGPT